jgi:hypothetical protein
MAAAVARQEEEGSVTKVTTYHLVARGAVRRLHRDLLDAFESRQIVETAAA